MAIPQTQQDRKMGSVGGMSADAPAGQFGAGPQIAVKPGGDNPGQHKDLRGNDAKAGEFNAGPQIGMTAKSGAGVPGDTMTVDAASAGQGGFTPGHSFGAKTK